MKELFAVILVGNGNEFSKARVGNFLTNLSWILS